MSATSLPITPESFLTALETLSIPQLHLELHRLHNSIYHLQRSNLTLLSPEFASDPECILAVQENEQVIQRQEERIGMLKAEVERRGFGVEHGGLAEGRAGVAGEGAEEGRGGGGGGGGRDAAVNGGGSIGDGITNGVELNGNGNGNGNALLGLEPRTEESRPETTQVQGNPNSGSSGTVGRDNTSENIIQETTTISEQLEGEGGSAGIPLQQQQRQLDPISRQPAGAVDTTLSTPSAGDDDGLYL